MVFAVAVHVARFGVIMFGLWLGPLIGITGWYTGLFVNVLCAIFAIGLVTYFRLWRSIGFLTWSRGRLALILLSVPILEAVFRFAPTGVSDEPPGFALWAVTLLLVGFNEELISRGVVLERLRVDFSPLWAVTITAALFGLQHLSAFATTGRDALDILGNVLASATYGFALAAFQYRFSWIWPLILIHAMADFTSILARTYYDDYVAAATSLVFVAYGIFVLRPIRKSSVVGADGARRDPTG